ncbi:cyclic nucleotide-binding domain-containing protein [Jiella sp. MQZ9-1]|uniref:Cyclic nucleotide-binding domain-containing protein n=1 Tax=Jiella flava TaxID=2816857 RepID=A0A939JWG0_9HYPH|nr:cyclic nucleotide-binding domain-containing protein [Jiella flava]MBO0662271.1 cyclic nucleotide-binding domain-containing protein [Jiella flava]MCD2470898.1 cyclic nucleotide-binding domain-containing protein [Jiella flava]
MSLESDIAILRKVRLFDDLETDQLRLLAFGAEHRRLHAGEFVFRENARADAGFVIVSGAVAMIHGRGEDARELSRHGAGALLGELCLIAETTRPASARAESDCALIRISRPLFRRMLEEYPDLAAVLHQRILTELETMLAEIQRIEGRFA